MEWQPCPVCKGTGLVSTPPGVAGDQLYFASTSAGPWPCRVCKGKGIIVRPADPPEDRPILIRTEACP